MARIRISVGWMDGWIEVGGACANQMNVADLWMMNEIKSGCDSKAPEAQTGCVQISLRMRDEIMKTIICERNRFNVLIESVRIYFNCSRTHAKRMHKNNDNETMVPSHSARELHDQNNGKVGQTEKTAFS